MAIPDDGGTCLPAFFLNPVPLFFSSSSSMSSFNARPSPLNVPCAVTREPALRFLAVCAPVWFDGPGWRLGRRRRKDNGLAREWAPPHYRA